MKEGADKWGGTWKIGKKYHIIHCNSTTQYCYEPSLRLCKRAQFPTETSLSHDHAHALLSCPSQLRSRNRDIAIAISPSPSQSQSRNQPFATSGVTTPVATARSPIARSLVVSIYSDHWSIPMPLLVLALTQLINGHGISPVSFHLTTCLPFFLVFSVFASEHPVATFSYDHRQSTFARSHKHPSSFLLVFANQPQLV
jgi:hypothetical protein